MRLRLAVVFRDMSARRTRPAGILRWYGYQYAAVPIQLVLQLPPKLEPTLIQNRFIQP